MTSRVLHIARSALRRTSITCLPHLLSAVAVAVVSLGVRVGALHAQDNSVAGRVQATGTNEPLRGAQISVVGGTQRAATDEQGHFRLTGLTGTSVVLDVRRISRAIRPRQRASACALPTKPALVRSDFASRFRSTRPQASSFLVAERTAANCACRCRTSRHSTIRI
jgi:hypothetical protein